MLPARRLSAALVGSLLLAGLVPATAVGATPSTPSVGRASSSPPAAPATEAADEATALALAGRYRSPVEALDLRTERSQTFAQPDGTLTMKQAAAVQRVRRGSGWVPVDTRVKRSGSVVVPEAAALDLRFSGGGSSPMVTLASGGRTFSLTWPTALPTPTLSGDTATYPEVLPGVDLRLTAAADSFSQVLVVKSAQAAQNPALARIVFGVSAQGLRLEQDAAAGFLRVVDPAGQVVFLSDGAQMWDSPDPVPASSASSVSSASSARRASAASGDPGAADPEPGRTEDVDVQVSSDRLTVVPSLDMLTDTDTNFPLYIDPGFHGDGDIWAPVSRARPDSSYRSGTTYRDEMRVGQTYGGASDDDWRTLMLWDISPFKGATILDASVQVNVWHTADCTPTPFQLWHTSIISKTQPVTWNNTVNKGWSLTAQRNATANKSSCPQGNDAVNFDQSAVRGVVQHSASSQDNWLSMGFRAKSESDPLQWKKLKPGTAVLEVSYNRTPGAPTAVAIDCHTACPGTTSTRRPKLSMAVKDPDGDKLTYKYTVWDQTKTKKLYTSGTTVSRVASGKTQAWQVPKDLPDGVYYWDGQGCDAHVCGLLHSQDVPMFRLTIDATNPKLPTVTSTDYPVGIWSKGPGQAGTFTFSPGGAADGVSKYTYSLQGGESIPAIPNSSGVASVAITPAIDGPNTISLTAFDLAGNRSDPVSYSFNVRSPDSNFYWSLDDAAGTTAAAQPASGSAAATMSGSGISWGTSGKGGSSGSATFTGAGEFTTASPMVRTTDAAGFTVAAWVRLPAPDVPDAPAVDPGDGSGDVPNSDDLPEDVPDTDPPVTVPALNQTAVSQDGANRSMFRLGYRNDLDATGDGAADPAWCFSVATADTPTAPDVTACSSELVTPGVWTHLVGTVDPINTVIRLYVNGGPTTGYMVPATGKALWEGQGRFAIGRSLAGGLAAERWNGDVDEVYASAGIWSDEKIAWRAGS
jgi:Concanavalin A-like lectin/glucanases superfamily